MKKPLTYYEMSRIRDSLYEEPAPEDCNECEVLARKMYNSLSNCKFNRFKKDLIRFVKHIQAEEKREMMGK